MQIFFEKFPIVLFLEKHIFDDNSEIVDFCEVPHNDHTYTRVEAHYAGNDADLVHPVRSRDKDYVLIVVKFQI